MKIIAIAVALGIITHTRAWPGILLSPPGFSETAHAGGDDDAILRRARVGLVWVLGSGIKFTAKRIAGEAARTAESELYNHVPAVPPLSPLVHELTEDEQGWHDELAAIGECIAQAKKTDLNDQKKTILANYVAWSKIIESIIDGLGLNREAAAAFKGKLASKESIMLRDTHVPIDTVIDKLQPHMVSRIMKDMSFVVAQLLGFLLSPPRNGNHRAVHRVTAGRSGVSSL